MTDGIRWKNGARCAVPPVGNGIWSQQDVFEIWSEEFEGMYDEGGFFNLMGHPQVIGRRVVRPAHGRIPGWPSRTRYSEVRAVM